MIVESSMTFSQGVLEKTVSLWSLINCQPDEFTNPMYAAHVHQHVLYPVTSLRRIQLWKAYYVKSNPRMRPQVLYKLVKGSRSTNILLG